jgi:hypothetical protein
VDQVEGITSKWLASILAISWREFE